MKGTREDWFPTSVWYFDLDDIPARHLEMIDDLRRLREEDEIGVTGRSTELGWHSHVDLHENPIFAPIMRAALDGGMEVAAHQDWDLDRVEIFVINSWGIINPKYGYNAMHNHPSSVLSGVYYIKAPENCGDIVFRDPREVCQMVVLPTKKQNRWTYQRVFYRPKEGRLLIFPSWLLHEVKPNLSEEERICVSFNIGYRQK
ncbi:MAG: hypothetical protein CMO55_28685 [Verrucomicrobiales bacterium]|nr:hypothetical protein [Verrucomicrobiales bacterium]